MCVCVCVCDCCLLNVWLASVCEFTVHVASIEAAASDSEIHLVAPAVVVFFSRP